jgi:hypothetical protein
MSGHQIPGAAGAANSPPAAPGRTAAGPLPRFGEQIDRAERLIAEAIAVLGQPVDPASAPTVQAWPSLSPDIYVHDVTIAEAVVNLQYALRKVGKAGALPVNPAPALTRGADPGVIAPACDQGTPEGPCAMPRYHSPHLGHLARP